MTKRQRLAYAHWSRFGPYRYKNVMTRDSRVIYYLIIKGKHFPVAGAVFNALSRDGLIMRE